VLAVWYVESSGRSFTPGHPVLRFENHKFFKYWGVDHEQLFDKHFRYGGHAGVPGKAYQNHKFRNSPNQAWRSVHIDSQEREYEVFALAERLGGREAACLSSSFGGPQIMGFNHVRCGYSSALAMADAFGTDNRWQVLGFYDFCKTGNLIDEVVDKRWYDFAKGYNGSSNANVYGPRIKDAFNERQALLALPKVPNPPVEMVALEAVVSSPRRAPAKRKQATRRKTAASKRKTTRTKTKTRRTKTKTSTRSRSRSRKAA
jgi:N-acetylmuramidase